MDQELTGEKDNGKQKPLSGEQRKKTRKERAAESSKKLIENLGKVDFLPKPGERTP